MLAAGMIAICLGQLSFEAQDFDTFAETLRVDYVDDLDLSQSLFDVDGDGNPDLVLEGGGVALQRAGRFPVEGHVVLPPVPDDGRRVVGPEGVYLLTGTTYAVHQWESDEWNVRNEGSAEWPGVALERIQLRDIDGDGVSEALWFTEETITVLRRGDSTWRITAAWDLGPVGRRVQFEQSAIWPMTQRKLGHRIDSASFQLTLGSDYIETGAWSRAPGAAWPHFEQTRTPFDRASLGLRSSERERRVSKPTDPAMLLQQEVLNGDDRLDFVATTPLPFMGPEGAIPQTEIRVSTNGGANFDVFRSRFSDQVAPCVDVNRDGRVDVVVHHSLLSEHGIREAMLRSATRSVVHHRIDIHLQQGDSTFPRRPSSSITIPIELDKPLIRLSEMALAYLGGALISVRGDFNGDGIADLVYLSTPNTLAVHLGSAAGFAKKPTVTLPVATIPWVSIADVNGDGLDDIVTSPYRASEREAFPAWTVFFAEAKP